MPSIPMKNRTTRGFLLVALLAIVATSCGDPTEPGPGLGDFLIRQPTDSPISTPPSYTTSPTATDSIHFEWEPSDGAERYTIVFERVETEEQMDSLGATFQDVTFALEKDDAEVVEVPLGAPPEEGEEDDRPLVLVVNHTVALSDVDAVLEQAGLPTGEPLYFVWSVVAHSGSRALRSIEVHRMILTRE